MNIGEWTTYWTISEWMIRVVMLPVIVMRKERPATCLAWLTVVFFAPVPGLLLYLLLGENRLGRRRLEVRKSRWAKLESVNAPTVGSHYVSDSYASDSSEIWGEPSPADTDDHPTDVTLPTGVMKKAELAPEVQPLSDLAFRLTGWPYTTANQVSFLCDPLLTIDRLVAEIDSAIDHVHLLYFIFRDDEVGRRVADALIRATQRGVQCRVLVDAVGSRHMLKHLAGHLRDAGVEVCPALPVRLYRIPFARLDLRNHRKLAIIDGRVAYTGSQNIVEPTYGQRRAGPWHDITARIVGPSVPHLQLLFLEDWFHETGQWLDEPRYFPPTEEGGDTILQLLPSGPDMPTELFQDLLVKAIFLAQRRVILTSPYFVPDEPLTMALRLAAFRGVQVDLVLPLRTDHPLVDAAGEFHWRRLSQHGVQVHFFREGLLHAKTLTIDDRLGLFGSANYDIRSFHLNFEVNLLIYSPKAVQDLQELQIRYLSASAPLTAEREKSLSTMRKLAIHLAKLLSPLL